MGEADAVKPASDSPSKPAKKKKKKSKRVKPKEIVVAPAITSPELKTIAGLLFSAEWHQPVIIQVPYLERYDPIVRRIFHELDISRWIKGSDLGIEDINHNVSRLRGAPRVSNTLRVFWDRSSTTDNRCLYNMIHGRKRLPWRGNIVVLKARGRAGAAGQQWQDASMADYDLDPILAHFREYGRDYDLVREWILGSESDLPRDLGYICEASSTWRCILLGNILN